MCVCVWTGPTLGSIRPDPQPRKSRLLPLLLLTQDPEIRVPMTRFAQICVCVHAGEPSAVFVCTACVCTHVVHRPLGEVGAGKGGVPSSHDCVGVWGVLRCNRAVRVPRVFAPRNRSEVTRGSSRAYRRAQPRAQVFLPKRNEASPNPITTTKILKKKKTRDHPPVAPFAPTTTPLGRV